VAAAIVRARTDIDERDQELDPGVLDEADHYAEGCGKEDDRVSCRIARVPLQFVGWDIDLGADRDMPTLERLIVTVIGDGAIGVAVLDMNFVAPLPR